MKRLATVVRFTLALTMRFYSSTHLKSVYLDLPIASRHYSLVQMASMTALGCCRCVSYCEEMVIRNGFLLSGSGDGTLTHDMVATRTRCTARPWRTQRASSTGSSATRAADTLASTTATAVRRLGQVELYDCELSVGSNADPICRKERVGLLAARAPRKRCARADATRRPGELC